MITATSQGFERSYRPGAIFDSKMMMDVRLVFRGGNDCFCAEMMNSCLKSYELCIKNDCFCAEIMGVEPTGRVWRLRTTCG